VTEKALERARHLAAELVRLSEMDDAGKSFDCGAAELISVANELVAELTPQVSTTGDVDRDALLLPAREAFDLLLELASSGLDKKLGLPSTPAKINKLLHRTLTEALSILLREDETLSLETLGGKRIVKRVQKLYAKVVYDLPKHLRVRPLVGIDRLTHELVVLTPDEDSE
jgi:hypothetical protein